MKEKKNTTDVIAEILAKAIKRLKTAQNQPRSSQQSRVIA